MENSDFVIWVAVAGGVAAALSLANAVARLCFAKHPKLLRFAPTIDWVLVVLGLAVAAASLWIFFNGDATSTVAAMGATIGLVVLGMGIFLVLAAFWPEPRTEKVGPAEKP